MHSYRLSLLIFFALAGCGMEAATPEDIAEAEQGAAGSGEVAVSKQAIANGIIVPNGQRGVVAIGRGTGNNFSQICTGVLISPKYLLTAASCTLQGGTRDATGSMNRTIRYYDPDDTVDYKRNITGENEALRVHVVETWDGLNNANALDYQDDLAVVWRSNGSNWISTENKDYMRIAYMSCYQGVTAMLYGAGIPEPANAGLRSMPSHIHRSDDYWFYDLEGYRSVCLGDAGGPYIVDAWWGDVPIKAVCGIHNAKEGNGECSSGGGRQYSARLSTNRITWLRDQVGVPCVRAGGVARCY